MAITAALRRDRPSVCTDIAWLQEQHQWPGLAAVGKVVRSCEINGVTSSRPPIACSAYRFHRPASPRWRAPTGGIENGLHWVLDVNMNEDQSRAPMNHAPRDYAPMGAKRVQARGIEGLDRRQAEASRLGRRFPRPPAHLPPANAIAPGSHRRVRRQTHLATSGTQADHWQDALRFTYVFWPASIEEQGKSWKK
jgi:hypothetical protein